MASGADSPPSPPAAMGRGRTTVAWEYAARASASTAQDSLDVAYGKRCAGEALNRWVCQRTQTCPPSSGSCPGAVMSTTTRGAWVSSGEAPAGDRHASTRAHSRPRSGVTARDSSRMRLWLGRALGAVAAAGAADGARAASRLTAAAAAALALSTSSTVWRGGGTAETPACSRCWRRAVRRREE